MKDSLFSLLPAIVIYMCVCVYKYIYVYIQVYMYLWYFLVLPYLIQRIIKKKKKKTLSREMPCDIIKFKK